jgi:hypothetical protein
MTQALSPLRSQPGDWWWQAFSNERMLSYTALAVLCVALLLFGALCLRRLGRADRRKPRPGIRSDIVGTATIEFALTIPVMLFLILLLAQTTFVMAGNLFVHYAAFTATRSAIVYIPADYGPGEPPNFIEHEPGSPKFDAIRSAAVFALAPIAGSLPGGNAPADAMTDALGQYYGDYARSAPRWIDRLLANRLHYADDRFNTRVTVYHSFVDSGGQVRHVDTVEGGPFFAPAGAISVRVEHRLNLSVPIVWALFADDRADGRYSLVAYQYTLTNEGVLDVLPPTPRLERLEPPDFDALD